MSSSRKCVEECPTGGVGSACTVNANECLSVTGDVIRRYRQSLLSSSSVRRDKCREGCDAFCRLYLVVEEKAKFI